MTCRKILMCMGTIKTTQKCMLQPMIYFWWYRFAWNKKMLWYPTLGYSIKSIYYSLEIQNLDLVSHKETLNDRSHNFCFLYYEQYIITYIFYNNRNILYADIRGSFICIIFYLWLECVHYDTKTQAKWLAFHCEKPFSTSSFDFQ